MIFSGVLLMAAAVISIDMFFERKRIELISAIYFGLLVGMILTILLSIGLSPLLATVKQPGPLMLMLGVILCYGCISLLIQTKDDFRFIIPYVEFARDLKGVRPFVLDTTPSSTDASPIWPILRSSIAKSSCRDSSWPNCKRSLTVRTNSVVSTRATRIGYFEPAANP